MSILSQLHSSFLERIREKFFSADISALLVHDRTGDVYCASSKACEWLCASPQMQAVTVQFGRLLDAERFIQQVSVTPNDPSGRPCIGCAVELDSALARLSVTNAKSFPGVLLIVLIQDEQLSENDSIIQVIEDSLHLIQYSLRQEMGLDPTEAGDAHILLACSRINEAITFVTNLEEGWPTRIIGGDPVLLDLDTSLFRRGNSLSLLEWIHPQDVDALYHVLLSRPAGQYGVQLRLRLRNRIGHYIHLRGNGLRIDDANGEMTAFAGMLFPEGDGVGPSLQPELTRSSELEHLELAEALGKDYIQNMLSLYSEVMNVHSTLYDMNHNIIAQSGSASNLCAFSSSYPSTNAICQASIRALCSMAQEEEPIAYTCDTFGLLCIASPIFIEGRKVGSWVAGSFLTEAITPEQITQRALAANLDIDAAMEAYKATPVITRNHLTRIEHLLKGFSEEMSAMGTRRLQLLRENASVRMAQKEIQDNYNEQSMITRLYNQIATAAQPEDAIPAMLSISAQHLHMSNAYLYAYDAKRDEARRIYGWAEAQAAETSLPATFSLSALPDPLSPCAESDVILTMRESQLPIELKDPRRKLLLLASITNGGEIVGLLGMEDHVTRRTLNDRETRVVRLVANILSNALARVRAEAEAHQSYSMFKTVMDHVETMVLVSEWESGEILFVNEQFRAFTGIEDFTGRHCWDVLFDDKDDICPQCVRNDPGYDGKNNEAYEVYNRRYGVWLRMMDSSIHWVDGRLAHMQSMVDITHTKTQALKTERMAFTDYLLGIPNRLRCEHDLAEELLRARHGETYGVVMFIDLDDFKIINDNFGHDYGDLLLKQVAEYLGQQPEIRDSYYRFGGDEFVLLLRGATTADAAAFTERVLTRFRQPWIIEGRAHHSTVSIGMAMYPKDGTTVGDIVRRADIAMYEAKSHGKDSAIAFTEDIGQDIHSRTETERRLIAAAQDIPAHFALHYHPIVEMHSGQIIGAEALLRWNDQQLGIVKAADFIDYAEYLGLLSSIEEWVLKTACHQCKAWQSDGLPNFKISINVSKKQLRSTGFVDAVKDALRESGLPAQCLTIEIGEPPEEREAASMSTVMNALREIGIHLAMDNFGASASGLNMLRSLPVNIIKIDRYFVQDLEYDDFSNAFMRAVISLAHDIDIQVCVGGVEDPAQRDAAESLSSDMAQGFFYDQPLPAEEFYSSTMRQNALATETTETTEPSGGSLS